MTAQKWLGVGIGVVVLVAAAYFIGQSSNDPRSLQAQGNLMQLQDTCHNWGNTILGNNKFYANPHVFTHYNTNLQECFVEVTSQTYSGTDLYVIDDAVFDAEKGTQILDSYTGSPPYVQSFTDYRPVNGAQSVMQITSEQFSVLRNQYMNN